MSRFPPLTEADSAVMELLWSKGPLTSNALLQQLSGTLEWTRQTARTYLARLMEKGLVSAREIKPRVYEYYSLVTRDEYAADRTGNLLQRYYGSLPHLVAGFVRNEKVSPRELEELEDLIRELRRKGGNPDA